MHNRKGCAHGKFYVTKSKCWTNDFHSIYEQIRNIQVGGARIVQNETGYPERSGTLFRLMKTAEKQILDPSNFSKVLNQKNRGITGKFNYILLWDVFTDHITVPCFESF